MKQRCLIGLFLLLCVRTVLAQPRLERYEMYIGVHAGILGSMISFSPDVTQSALHPYWGPNAGLVFRYSGQKCCGLQVELNYMQRGWHETLTDYRRQLDYLEIPFLTHIWFGRKFRGFVNLGPQIGFLVHESHYGLPEETQPQHLSLDSRFDWGLAGGLGMLYRSVAGVWQLEARFNYSFGDVFANHKTDYFARSNSMNLSLNLAWFWQIR
ncbi:MAG: PorT family protein [Paludibacter sp.]|nr:PorT family protein [Bacteroidales bacterium]MCM1069172.1 PorT family protein [Prevotella sp.]MCM1354077.1 PorT family protein [Bacteroides sp.]MCM1442950.1 PorT family protein [Muribaculum sp.]MCM1481727.1 PorT family protein [Paludibacter sp.]